MKNTVKVLGVIISLLMIFTMFSCESGASVKSIEITEFPNETSLIAGNVYNILDVTVGMEVKITHADGTSELYNSSEGWEFFTNELKFTGDCIDNEGYVTPAMGKNVITLSYGGKSAEFTIIGVGLENIEIVHTPDRTEFIANKEYSVTNYFTGLEVKANYSDGTSKLYSYEDDFRLFETEFVFSGACIEGNGYFTPAMGENVITLTHRGKTATFTVIGGEVESIEVTKIPDASFIVGNKFYVYDFLYGMELRVNYTDKTSVTYKYEKDKKLFYDLVFSGDCVDEENENIIPHSGKNVITVAFGDKTTNFTVTGVEVESVEVTQNPDRTDFIVGGEYYLIDYYDGMEVSLNFSDGSKRLYKFEDDWTFFYDELKLSGENISGDAMMFIPVKGDNVITVTCSDKTTEFILTGIEVEGVEVTKNPNITEYTAGKLYDIPAGFEGLEVKVSYSNGTDELYTYDDNKDFFAYELKYSGECVDEFGVGFTPVSGDNVITVECAGKTAEFTIKGV